MYTHQIYIQDTKVPIERPRTEETERYCTAIARTAARRVAWAVAQWYRDDNGMDASENLPESLQRVLCEQAPD